MLTMEGRIQLLFSTREQTCSERGGNMLTMEGRIQLLFSTREQTCSERGGNMLTNGR
jgi:predicted nucleic acid-binding Zn ribbon protein